MTGLACADDPAATISPATRTARGRTLEVNRRVKLFMKRPW
jgi:hypothetical protein